MNDACKRLSAAGIENAAREWRILQSQFSGDALEKALEARIERKPMSQILGYRDFWKDRFIVNEHVLDPRPDSELFLELALELPKPPQSVLDLGTGSGALALSLLREFVDAKAVMVDQSEDALRIAQQNAQALGSGDRVKILQSDWFERVDRKFDLIVCNPPYLTQAEFDEAQSELKYEPAAALTDFEDGLCHYRKIALELRDYLAPQGIAMFEHGFQQYEEVAEIFEARKFSTEIHRDLSGNPRITVVSLAE